MEFDADVIIAGAGMAGATLALALKQGGLEPLLIDPMPFDTQLAPSFDGRSSAIAFASFRQWRTLGLAQDIEPHAQRIEQILVTDGKAPGGAAGHQTPFYLRFDSAEISERSEGEPLGYMLENRRTRVALAAAVARAGIRILAPARVAGVELKSGHAEVRLQDGQILRAAALDGMGILVQPTYILYDDIVAGRLVPVLDDWDLPRLTVNLAYPSRKHLSAKVRTFIDFMAGHFAKMNYEQKWTGRFGMH